MWVLMIILVSTNGGFSYVEKQRGLTEQSCIEASNQLKHYDIQSVCVERGAHHAS